jgi:hypothetical protein
MVTHDAFVLGWQNWIENTFNYKNRSKEFPKCTGVLCVVRCEGPNKLKFIRVKGEIVTCIFRVHCGKIELRLPKRKRYSRKKH